MEENRDYVEYVKSHVEMDLAIGRSRNEDWSFDLGSILDVLVEQIRLDRAHNLPEQESFIGQFHYLTAVEQGLSGGQRNRVVFFPNLKKSVIAIYRIADNSEKLEAVRVYARELVAKTAPKVAGEMK